MQGRTHIFDATMGIPDDGDNWLDRKVLRRELTDSLNKESINERIEKAGSAAQDFLDDLSRKANLRNDIERKSGEIRRQHQQVLQQQADEYRKKLQSKLRPELRD